MLEFTTDLYTCRYTEIGYKQWNYREVTLNLNETQKKKYNATEDYFDVVNTYRLYLAWDDTKYGGINDTSGLPECYSADKGTGR